MKHLIVFTLLAALLSAVQAFALTVYAPKAPPTIPLLKTAEKIKSLRVVYYSDVQTEVIPRILKEKDGLYILPSNIAAKLYNKKIPVRVLGVTTLGFLYIITSDPKISRIEDLDGKSVSIGEPGSSPDVFARFLFNRKMIKPVIVYGSTPSITQYLIGGKISTAVLPEPYASMVLSKNPSSRRTIDLKAVSRPFIPGDPGIPQTVLAGKAEYIAVNKKEIAALVRAYRESVLYAEKYPKAVSRFSFEKLGINMTLESLESSLPYMNLTFLSGAEARSALTKYYRCLMQTDKQSVGEKIPDEKFYIE